MAAFFRRVEFATEIWFLVIRFFIVFFSRPSIKRRATPSKRFISMIIYNQKTSKSPFPTKNTIVVYIDDEFRPAPPDVLYFNPLSLPFSVHPPPK